MSQHWYNADGDLCDPWEKGAYPSPNTILDRVRSDSLEALQRRLGQEEADEVLRIASERGTRVHKACELWLGNGFNYEYAAADAELRQEELSYFNGFVGWWNKYKPELVDSELVVISHRFKYAGRLDLIVRLDGQLWIIDIKTGQDSVRHGLQLKFYQEAYSSTWKPRMAVLALDANRACGYRHSKSLYGLLEYKESRAAILAHIAVFRWWNKKHPAIKPVQAEDLFRD